jgi:NADP-dependent 3-hydroxy acid dehydrogenase YdfG
VRRRTVQISDHSSLLLKEDFMAQQKVVLITGASSGIGLAIADWLAGRGYRVFGTSRNPKQAQQNGWEMMALDVTSDESVAQCITEVINRAGRIDVLVNNAGADIAAAVEEASIEEAKALFDLNFFGVMRMCKVVLPHMREQRSGTIINIGSSAAFLVMPFNTLYGASKLALEGFSQGLRAEVMPFNIRVSLIEPGFFRSNIRNAVSEPAQTLAIYERERRMIKRGFDERVEHGLDPVLIGQLVERIIESPAPGLHHPIAPMAQLLNFTRRAIPEDVTASFSAQTFGLERSNEPLARFGLGVLLVLISLLVTRGRNKRR